MCEHLIPSDHVSSKGAVASTDGVWPATDDRLRLTAMDDGWLLSGEIDSYTAPALSVVLAESAGFVVLDLEGVTFMDSSGLQCVIDATRDLRASNGDLTLRRPGPAVRRLIEVTGLDAYLGVVL